MKKVIKATRYNSYDSTERAYERYANNLLNVLRKALDTMDNAPNGFLGRFGLDSFYQECLDSAQNLDWDLNGDSSVE